MTCPFLKNKKHLKISRKTEKHDGNLLGFVACFSAHFTQKIEILLVFDILTVAEFPKSFFIIYLWSEVVRKETFISKLRLDLHFD
jgi:hypothetical protein